MSRIIKFYLLLICCGLLWLAESEIGHTAPNFQWRPTQITPRRNHAMTASPSTAYLFGGESNGHYLNDLWAWDGTTWQLLAQDGPSPRTETTLVYDEQQQALVLYGGWNGSSELGDTWVWDGAEWSQLSPDRSPPVLRRHAMIYDSARQQIILFGGISGVETDQTWLWDGTTWTQQRPSHSPPPTSKHVLAYDSMRERVVLFGGVSGLHRSENVWEWDGNTWTQVGGTSGPIGRTGHLLAPMNDGVLLFGGESKVGLHSDLWHWNGQSWYLYDVETMPAARMGVAGAYLSESESLLLVGGADDTHLLDDIWQWREQRWHLTQSPVAPAARSQHAMSVDETRKQVVLFGGTANDQHLGDTWTWDESGWNQHLPAHSPSVRFGHSMAYDAQQQQTVLFGGHAEQSRRDTWTWDGATWTLQRPSQAPERRWDHAMTYDVTNEEVILFGGSRDGVGFYGDTWRWDGTTWHEANPEQAPHARRGHALIYDRKHQRVVLFGGYHFDGTNATYFNDTWEWDGTTWSEIKADISPQGRSGHTLYYDAALERVVLLGGHGAETLDEATWAWDGQAWQRLGNRVVPDSRSLHTAVYQAHSCQAILFGGLGRGGPLADTWIRQTESCDAAPTPVPTHKSWTMMLYLAGDTELYDQGFVHQHLAKAIERLSEGENITESINAADVNVVALLDGPNANDTQRITFRPQAQFESVGEKAMDDPQTLIEFVQAAQREFPAQHYYLAITDHANGVQGIAWDTTSNSDGSALLTPQEIRLALQTITDDGETPIDVLHFDGCSFGLLENASLGHGFVDYIAASQNTGWGAFAYDDYRAAINAQTTPREFAQQVAERYAQKVQRYELPYTISVLEMARFNPVIDALNVFSDRLSVFANTNQNNRALIQEIRSQSQKFDSGGEPYLAITEDDAYVDLADFAVRIQQQVDDRQLSDDAAQLVATLIGNGGLVLYEDHQSGSFDYGGSNHTWRLDRTFGVSIYYPMLGAGSEFGDYINGTTFPYFHGLSRWYEFLQIGVLPLETSTPLTPKVLAPLAPLELIRDFTIYLPTVRH